MPRHFVSCLLLFLACAFAPAVRAADAAPPYVVKDAVLRLAPNGLAAGYAVIDNPTSQDDALLGAEASWARDVALHETAAEAGTGVMRMRSLPRLALPAQGQAALRPGRAHLMLSGLGNGVAIGATRTITLRFEQAGRLDVPFKVENAAATTGAMPAVHHHMAE